MGEGTEGTLRRHPRALRVGVALTASILLSASLQTADADTVPHRSFWNTLEIASTDLGPFWKWRSVLERYALEMTGGAVPGCSPSLFSDCPYEEWRRFLDEIADTDRWSQLVAVNSFFNARRYIPDERNWGIKDYWATPVEFMNRAGDCEDYAIAKYMSLKELGWSEDDLRVVVVRDAKLRSAHAVLVVVYEHRTWVLDNQTAGVDETADVEHYRPVFSINETSWWHHQPDAAPPSGRRPAAVHGAVKLDATPAAADADR